MLMSAAHHPALTEVLVSMALTSTTAAVLENSLAVDVRPQVGHFTSLFTKSVSLFRFLQTLKNDFLGGKNPVWIKASIQFSCK